MAPTAAPFIAMFVGGGEPVEQMDLRPTCGHNSWADVRQRKGVKMLRCCVCQVTWRWPKGARNGGDAPTRCIPYLNGDCPLPGPQCPLLHIRRARAPDEAGPITHRTPADRARRAASQNASFSSSDDGAARQPRCAAAGLPTQYPSSPSEASPSVCPLPPSFSAGPLASDRALLARAFHPPSPPGGPPSETSRAENAPAALVSPQAHTVINYPTSASGNEVTALLQTSSPGTGPTEDANQRTPMPCGYSHMRAPASFNEVTALVQTSSFGVLPTEDVPMQAPVPSGYPPMRVRASLDDITASMLSSPPGARPVGDVNMQAPMPSGYPYSASFNEFTTLQHPTEGATLLASPQAPVPTNYPVSAVRMRASASLDEITGLVRSSSLGTRPTEGANRQAPASTGHPHMRASASLDEIAAVMLSSPLGARPDDVNMQAPVSINYPASAVHMRASASLDSCEDAPPFATRVPSMDSLRRQAPQTLQQQNQQPQLQQQQLGQQYQQQHQQQQLGQQYQQQHQQQQLGQQEQHQQQQLGQQEQHQQQQLGQQQQQQLGQQHQQHQQQQQLGQQRQPPLLLPPDEQRSAQQASSPSSRAAPSPPPPPAGGPCTLHFLQQLAQLQQKAQTLHAQLQQQTQQQQTQQQPQHKTPSLPQQQQTQQPQLEEQQQELPPAQVALMQTMHMLSSLHCPPVSSSFQLHPAAGEPPSPPAEPQSGQDEADAADERLKPPCDHNTWDEVRQRKGVKMLRCAVCRAPWRWPKGARRGQEGLARCIPFLNGECPKAGTECDLLHIRRSKASEQRLLKDRAEAALAASAESNAFLLWSSGLGLPPSSEPP
ncbi:hypothetical protein DIPPA_34129 [Diplonema papillatum]|nr:hypothetical protein DIPPA_34129 [Diplonema papillatum]